MKKILFLVFLVLPMRSFAETPYYYHTINTNSISAAFGRTVKVNYNYQLTRLRQLRVSALYLSDQFDLDRNTIQAKLYNLNVQFKYDLFYLKNSFLNLSIGLGGYYLDSKDKLDVQYNEWHISLVAGGQFEWYIKKNTLALIADIDFLYLPFSKLYTFLWVPTAGVGIFF